ncbi:hypothetical protein C0J52_08362 [Blattella germanica]|nr:hypothetical protein C0J52_08362 [Blattella germanica]
MAHRKKISRALQAALADIGVRIPVVKLERVDKLLTPFQKSALQVLSEKIKNKGLEKERKASSTKNTSRNLETSFLKLRETKKVVKREGQNRNKRENNQGSSLIKKQVKNTLDSRSREMFPEISGKDISPAEPPKKQHKLHEGTIQNKQVINEKISPSRKNLSQQTCTEVMCDSTPSPSFSVNAGSDPAPNSNPSQTYLGNTACATGFMQLRKESAQKDASAGSWENGRSTLNSLSFSNTNVSGVQTSTYSTNAGSVLNAGMVLGNIGTPVNSNPFSVNIRPSFAGQGPSATTLAYAGNNGQRLNPIYSDISRPIINALPCPRGPILNSPSFPGNTGPGINIVTYPSNNSGMNPTPFSGNSVQGIHSMPYAGYSNIPVCTGNNVTGMNSQTYSGNVRAALNPNYPGNNAQGMNSMAYSGNIRPVYYASNVSGVASQPYSGNAPNSSAYSGNSATTYNNSPGINSLSYTVNTASGLTPQPHSGNSGLGMNTVSYPSNNAVAKLSTVNYCAPKGTDLNTLSYPGNNTVNMNTSAYSGTSNSGTSLVFAGSSMTSPDYSANTSAASYSGNNVVPANQASSSFPGNVIGQQYEVLQNYCENGSTGINTTSCPDTAWSNDYITLNNISTNGYQVAGCSLDFSFMYSCQICGTIMPMVNDMIKHWRIHNGVESLTCTSCYVSFTDVLFLQAHWKAIHMGGICTDPGVILRSDQKVSSDFTCEACGFAFSQFASLEQHVISTHVNNTQQQRDNVSWKGTMYGIDNTQQNHVINNKSLQNIPLTSDHSMTNALMGTSGQEQSMIEHQNVLDEGIMGNKLGSISETEEALDSKVKIEVVDNRIEDKMSPSSDDSSSSETEKPFKCKVCDSFASSLEEILEHWRIHIGADTSTCSMCKKTFSDLPFLQAHWRRSHMNAFQISSLVTRNSLLPDDSSSLTCDACGYAFPDFPELEQHMMSSHVFSGHPQVPLRSRNSADNIQKFSLTQLQNVSTSRTISNKSEIMNHCKKKDAPSELVRKVVNDKIEIKKKDEQSDAKREEMRRKVNRSAFIKSTVSSDGCLVCGEIPSDMIKHLVTHTGLSTLECCLCGKDFVDVPFLQAHWRATHMNGEVRHTNHGIYVGNYKENVSYTGKFLCETCGCYVPQFSALEKHIVLTHTIIEPPYVCKCGHRFSSEDELKRHISTCSW